MKPWKIYLVFQGIVTGLQILLPIGNIKEYKGKKDVKNDLTGGNFRN